MNKGLKFRIYPTQKQKELIDKSIGCARLTYNLMLDYHNQRYQNKEKFLNKFTAITYFKKYIKPNYLFLYEIDKWVIDNAIKNLDQAFQNFFNRCKKHTKSKKGYPKFKSRYTSRLSYTTLNVTDIKNHNSIELFDKYVKLPKLKKVKAEITQIPNKEFKIKQSTIIKERDNKYYCSLCYEYEEDIKQQDLVKGLGLDYSSTNFYVDNNGNTAPKHNKTYKCSEKKIKKLNRQLLKKKLHSKNFTKAKIQLAKAYRHSSNARKDYLHKLSTTLSNNYDYICVEDLNLKGLINQKDIRDNAWGTFITYLNYKLQDRGKQLIKVDRFYPSSQLCSQCGYQNKDIKDISIKEWECPHCHMQHKRDENAAKNILQEGKRLLREQNLLVA